MRIITVTALFIVLAGSVSCGKKSSTTDNPSAQAITLPLTGTWTGTGSHVIDGGAPAACSVVTVTFAFTTSSVTVSNLSSTCGGITVSEDPLTLTYTNGQLLYQGVNVGTITDQNIHISLVSGSDSADMQFALQDATHLNYSETDVSGVHTFTASGALVSQ